jgi:hypothetical protein
MCKIKFMKHKKLSSTHYLTVNISGLDGDSLADGALGCTTCSETTSTVAVSVDGADGNGGGGGWHTGWCDGRGGGMGGLHVNPLRMCAIRLMLRVGCDRPLTGCTSDCNSLGLEKGNPEATPRCPGSAIVL